MNRAPDDLRIKSGSQGLNNRPAAETVNHIVASPRFGVAGAKRHRHSMPELRQTHGQECATLPLERMSEDR